MRRFRFSLQAVLRLRTQLERGARRTLASAAEAVAAADRRLANVSGGLRECGDQAAGAGPATALARALEAGLRRQQRKLQGELRRAEAAAEAARVDYLERRRDQRTIERLRQHRHDAWRLAAGRAEQAEMDELARLARAARREDPR